MFEYIKNIEYKWEKIALLFVVTLPFISYTCNQKFNKYLTNRKKQEYYLTEFRFFVKEKLIDTSFNGRGERYLLLRDSLSTTLFRFGTNTYIMDINSLWKNVEIGDKLIKTKRTLYILRQNNHYNDTFWYKSY